MNDSAPYLLALGVYMALQTVSREGGSARREEGEGHLLSSFRVQHRLDADQSIQLTD